jgi:hypothetical protein
MPAKYTFRHSLEIQSNGARFREICSSQAGSTAHKPHFDLFLKWLDHFQSHTVWNVFPYFWRSCASAQRRPWIFILKARPLTIHVIHTVDRNLFKTFCHQEGIAFIHNHTNVTTLVWLWKVFHSCVERRCNLQQSYIIEQVFSPAIKTLFHLQFLPLDVSKPNHQLVECLILSSHAASLMPFNHFGTNFCK